jgi:simple sugar transport system permease protein
VIGRVGSVLANVVLYVVAIVLALAIASALVVLTTDASPFEVIKALYRGSFSTAAALGFTLEQATPILIVALGSVIASRSGLFNIGPEGQFMVGGVAGALIAFKLGGPPQVVVPLTLLAAALGGACWAGIAATLRAWRNVDVIVTTLLLNFVAIQVVSYAVNRHWLLQERTGGRIDPPQSPRLEADYRLPKFGSALGFETTSGIVLALLLTCAVAYALTQTRWGFRLRMLGMNPVAARAAGVNLVVLGGGALVLSGAFAGLSGGVFFAGTGYRISPDVLSFGYQGLLVALISRGNVFATVPLALAFGALRSGGGFLGATGVPRHMVDVVQALVVLAALMPPAILYVFARRRELRVAREAAQLGTQARWEAA